MLTNHYYTFQKMLLFNTSSSSTGWLFEGTARFPNGVLIGKGTDYNFNVTNSSSPFFAMQTAQCTEEYGATATNPATNCGVFFGSGTTPATKEDYTLEIPIKSGLSIANESGDLRYKEQADGSIVFSRAYILANTSDAPIVVGEIGMLAPVSGSSTSKWPILIERTVLASPVTISPGDEKLVTYKVTIPNWQRWSS